MRVLFLDALLQRHVRSERRRERLAHLLVELLEALQQARQLRRVQRRLRVVQAGSGSLRLRLGGLLLFARGLLALIQLREDD